MNHLAEWCVEHGVIELFDDRKGEPTYAMDGEYLGTAEEAMRDWRVAGKLMERVQAVFIERLNANKWAVRADHSYGNRTREWHDHAIMNVAIVEACIGALS